jgi:hypothetical protein
MGSALIGLFHQRNSFASLSPVDVRFVPEGYRVEEILNLQRKIVQRPPSAITLLSQVESKLSLTDCVVDTDR